jgi:hypothetical protein
VSVIQNTTVGWRDGWFARPLNSGGAALGGAELRRPAGGQQAVGRCAVRAVSNVQQKYSEFARLSSRASEVVSFEPPEEPD